MNAQQKSDVILKLIQQSEEPVSLIDIVRKTDLPYSDIYYVITGPLSNELSILSSGRVRLKSAWHRAAEFWVD